MIGVWNISINCGVQYCCCYRFFFVDGPMNSFYVCIAVWTPSEEKNPTQATYVYIFCTNRNGALLSTFFPFLSLDMEAIGTYNGEKAFVVSLLIVVCDFVLGNRRLTIAKHWTWLLFLCQVGALCKHDNYDIQRSNQRCLCYYLTSLHLPLLLFYLPLLRPAVQQTHESRNRDRAREREKKLSNRTYFSICCSYVYMAMTMV